METIKRHTCIRCKKKKEEERMKIFGTTFLGTHWICEKTKLRGGWWRPETCEPVTGSLWLTLVEQLGILFKLFAGTDELAKIQAPKSQPGPDTLPGSRKGGRGGLTPAGVKKSKGVGAVPALIRGGV